MQYQENISSIFSSNFEANASKLLENIEDITFHITRGTLIFHISQRQIFGYTLKCYPYTKGQKPSLHFTLLIGS